MAYKDIIENILKTNDSIRFATICDMDGNVSQTGHHESVRNLLSFNENMQLLKLAAKSWKSRNAFSSKIGNEKTVIVIYEKLKRITISFGDKHLIVITIDVDTDHDKIINDIIQLEKKHLKI